MLKKRWEIIRLRFGVNITCLEDIITLKFNPAIELIVSCVLKQLIQIDRSQNMTINKIINNMNYYLKIEQIVKKHDSAYINALLEKLKYE